MRKTKLLVSIILVLALTLSQGAMAFAADNSADIKAKAQSIADEYGAKLAILSPDETAKCKLNFNTIEDFEKYLKEMKTKSAAYKSNVNLTSSTLSNSSTLVMSANSYSIRRCMADNTNFINFTLLAGFVRNELFANVSYNYTFNEYCFMNVASQSSYIASAQFAGWSWTQTFEQHGIMDSGRTLWSHLYGYSKLSVSIGGFGLGYTWSNDWYNEWYSQSTL